MACAKSSCLGLGRAGIVYVFDGVINDRIEEDILVAAFWFRALYRYASQWLIQCTFEVGI
jgi:hypothetical protein